MKERIKLIWDSKLKVTEEHNGESGLPRVVRLSNRLKLSDKEKMVMYYTLCCQVGESRNATGTLRFVQPCQILRSVVAYLVQVISFRYYLT